MDVTVIDTETTGLKKGWHEVIDIYLMRLDETLDVKAEGGALIAPMHIERAATTALATNHFSEPRWSKDAVSWADAWPMISELLEGARPAGHVVQFDLGMIAAMCQRDGLAMPRLGRPIDTCQMARDLKKSGRIKNCKLSTVLSFFGIENRLAHSAEGDTRATVELLKKLWKPTLF